VTHQLSNRSKTFQLHSAALWVLWAGILIPKIQIGSLKVWVGEFVIPIWAMLLVFSANGKLEKQEFAYFLRKSPYLPFFIFITLMGLATLVWQTIAVGQTENVTLFRITKYFIYSLSMPIGYLAAISKLRNAENPDMVMSQSISGILKLNFIMAIVTLAVLSSYLIMDGIPPVSYIIWNYDVRYRAVAMTGKLLDIFDLGAGLKMSTGAHGVLANMMAFYLILLLSFKLFRVSVLNGRWLRIGSILLFVSLALSVSREGLATLGVGLIAFIITSWRLKKSPITTLGNVWLPLLVVVAGIAILKFELLMLTVFSKIQLNLDKGVVGDASLHSRLVGWYELLHVFQDRPFSLFFGNGYGFALIQYFTGGQTTCPESLLATSIFTIGFWGPLLMLFFWLIVLRSNAPNRIQKTNEPIVKALRLALFCWFIGFLVPNVLSGETLLVEYIMVQIFALIGILCGYDFFLNNHSAK